MAEHVRELHDHPMGRHDDEKLRIIADSVVGRRCSAHELRELGRSGDLIDCAAGRTFHAETDPDRWAYLLLDGNVAVSHAGNPLAVATRGTWFPLRPSARTPRHGASLTALSDSQLLVFRSQDLGPFLDRDLAAASR